MRYNEQRLVWCDMDWLGWTSLTTTVTLVNAGERDTNQAPQMSLYVCVFPQMSLYVCVLLLQDLLQSCARGGWDP
jgi:hypothetical protein